MEIHKNISEKVKSLGIPRPYLIADSDCGFLTIKVMKRMLSIPKKEILAQYEAGNLEGFRSQISNKIYFTNDAPQKFIEFVRRGSQSVLNPNLVKQTPILQMQKIQPQHEYNIPSDHIVINKMLQIDSVNSEILKPEIIISREVDRAEKYLTTSSMVLKKITREVKCESPTARVLKEKCILSTDINNIEMLQILNSKNIRVIKVTRLNSVGLKLEVSMLLKRLVIKGSYNGENFRCILKEWTLEEKVTELEIDSLVTEFQRIENKLNRKPTSAEFRVHTLKLATIGDALNAHLEFNIKDKHGEGSNEWKILTALIENHLSKDIEIELSNNQKVIIRLIDEPLVEMTIHRFESYLRVFKEFTGTHDKIVTRVKAAINYCFQERLIRRDDIDHFHEAKRINNERHVKFSDKDLKDLFRYLDKSEDTEFRFFMNMQSTGHFRTDQVMNMKYADFDFNHSKVKVKPKKGKHVWIPLPEDLRDLVKARMEQCRSSNEGLNYLFPSKIAKNGHKANFTPQWNALRLELNFYIKDENDKIDYKYVLHDFRETLLGRLDSLDDPTLAGLLGHLSLHSLKNYRVANIARVKDGAETGYARLKAIIS